ncbi:uncharacterized protein LOC131181005 [Hevea brasiliensis]|uniref:uncharacterized protein LOC131181005 n=1 Tax=Hevea brasiliensis TaxID=3981 RepID=UPI0025FC7F24|nr:uncharacterized protein LOC131181005 [Hevea brasiliensis]
MGLGENYDHVRNQILIQDPLPNVNKAYSMTLSVEIQREVHGSMTQVNENVAMVAKSDFGKKDARSSKTRKGDKKDDRFCNYCNKSGHVRETCFKLNGYPDWFQDFKQKKFGKGQAHMTLQDTPLDVPTIEWGKEFSTAVHNEVAKYMKGKMNVEDVTQNCSGYAGPMD